MESLEARLRAGRSTVEALKQRLEGVRTRAESWEKREQEWQAQTTKRLRILWGVISGLVFAFVLLMVIQYGPANTATQVRETARLVREKGRSAARVEKVPDIGGLLAQKGGWSWNREEQVSLETKAMPTGLPDDIRLRLFDEL